MTRFKMVKQPKGVWDIMKSKDGPWMLFEDHEKITAEQRQEIARQAKRIAELEAHCVDCPTYFKEEHP